MTKYLKIKRGESEVLVGRKGQKKEFHFTNLRKKGGRDRGRKARN